MHIFSKHPQTVKACSNTVLGLFWPFNLLILDVKSVFNRRDSRDGLAKAKDGFIEDCTHLLADEDQIVAEFAVNMLANISQGIF